MFSLTSISTIKQLCDKHGIKMTRSLGQNFLIDKNILTKIIDAIELSKKDNVLEAGPGLGVLTQELAQKAGKVVSVEKDKKLIPAITEVMEGFKNFQLITGDFLRLTEDEIIQAVGKDYVFASNLPYNVASQIIFKLLELSNQPKRMTVLVQLEQAERMAMNTDKTNIFGLLIQYLADVKILFQVKPGCFYPAPKVTSALIRIIPKIKANAEYFHFAKLVKAGFANKRKFLISNLANYADLKKEQLSLIFSSLNILPTVRAEDLDLDQWKELARRAKGDGMMSAS